MAEQLLTCPNCQSQIPLTDVLTRQIKDELRTEIESATKEKEKKLIEKEQALLKKESSIEKTVNEKLLVERNNLRKKLVNEVENKFSLEMDDLKEQLREQKTTNEKLKEAELKARKTGRQLEEMKESFNRNLEDKTREIEKSFILQKDKLKKEIQDQTQNESIQRLGEKEKTIDLLRAEINKLKQTAEQGSQQIQGEVTEERLKIILKENFYEDLIEDVPVGVNGADIIQTIRSFQGKICGIILWESKNTKLWQDTWIEKLKADHKLVNANFSILVSKTLPKEISSFGDIRNVWVTSMDLVVPLAKILRNAIIELHRKDQSLEGKNLKMERLYSYLTSSGFKTRVTDCLESFNLMDEELKKEIRTTKKRWAKRGELIKRAEDNILSMHGSFEGIAGDAIPQLENITDNLLEAGDDADEENL